MNMMTNGPRIRLASTPGRRTTSRSSLPVKEAIRTMLCPISCIGQTPRLALVLGGDPAIGPTLLDEAGEDLVEARLMLLDAGDLDPAVPKRVDDARGQAA